MNTDERFFAAEDPASHLLLNEFRAACGRPITLADSVPGLPFPHVPPHRPLTRFVPDVMRPQLGPVYWEAIKLVVIVLSAIIAVHYLGKK